MKPPTEAQIREALDGKFVVHHFSGRLNTIAVPTDFDPFSREGERIIQKHGNAKVPGA